MKMRVFALVCVTTMAIGTTMAQSVQHSQFVGVWRGQLDGLPGVDMVITDEGGGLHGGILFYLHMRRDPQTPYTSTPGLPEPMLELKPDGQVLTFEVSHRRAHPPGTLNDSPKTFYLKIEKANKAKLVSEDGGGPTVLLTRSDY